MSHDKSNKKSKQQRQSQNSEDLSISSVPSVVEAVPRIQSANAEVPSSKTFIVPAGATPPIDIEAAATTAATPPQVAKADSVVKDANVNKTEDANVMPQAAPEVSTSQAPSHETLVPKIKPSKQVVEEVDEEEATVATHHAMENLPAN